MKSTAHKILSVTTFSTKLVLAVVAFFTFTTTASTMNFLTINSSPVMVDNAARMMLASIEKERFGGSLEATMTCHEGFKIVSIDDVPIQQENKNYTFTDITAGKTWKVVSVNELGDTATHNLQFTYLPLVAMQGSPDYEYSMGSLAIAEPGKALTEPMKAKIKWRGGTTNYGDKHKRNYNIKFVNEQGEKQNQKLLDMRRDNHWILEAGQADMARVRNRVATDLWLDMARPPYYYDQAPDALTGARGKVVELFLEGDYRGIYILTEVIDRKQLQLVKHDTINNVFHGGLWKSDKFNAVTGFKSAPIFNDSLPDYHSFVTKYPELDEVFPTSYQVLYDAVKAMTLSEDIDNYNSLAEQHFDMPVMIDYTIFYITLNANDNSTKNIYWLCHDRQQDKRLSIAVWDLDATVGQSWSPNDWRPPTVASDYFNQPYTWVFKMLLHNRCKFRQQFLDRYDELRLSWLSTDNLVQRYQNAIDELIDCGAANREEQRWNGDSDLLGHDLNFAAEKLYISQWFRERMPLLDTWMHHHICDVNFDGAVTASDLTAVYNFILFESGYDQNLDTNFDGFITSSDITSILNVILGLD